MKINHVLPSSILVSKYSQDFVEQYKIDESNEWLKEILVELEEDNDEDFEREKAKMTIEADITRKTNKFLGDHIILRSKVHGHYHLPCGRCLAPVRQDIDLKIDAAFLSDTMEKMPEYQDVTTVYADNQEMELYFFRKGMADVKELFHEQLYTEIEPFPRCTGECRGQILF